jgi:hypothetical protein
MFSQGGGKAGNGAGSGDLEDDIDDFSSFVKEEKDNFHVPPTDAFSGSINFDKNAPDFNFSSNFEDLEIDTFFESGVGTGMGLMESGQGFTSFPEGQGTLWVKQQSFGDEIAESTMETIDRERIDGYSYGTGKKKERDCSSSYLQRTATDHSKQATIGRLLSRIPVQAGCHCSTPIHEALP